MSGFSHGTLPFKYLGVPICFKKISAREYDNLAEKITARIRIGAGAVDISHTRKD